MIENADEDVDLGLSPSTSPDLKSQREGSAKTGVETEEDGGFVLWSVSHVFHRDT